MARLKSSLIAIFKDCKTNTDIYHAMMEARRAGFSKDEVTSIVAKTRKDIMSQTTNYKRLLIKNVSVNYFQQYHVGHPVIIRNINDPIIELSKEGVLL